MASKIKNDSSKYLTRAALAGAVLDSKGETPLPSTESQRIETEQRDARGTLDRRWYIQLLPKR